MARALMFQGTGSDVGKSLMVAGLCRLFARRGMRVLPFKAQNMSNNAAVTAGGEIGRAQALQAMAAGVVPGVHMNPVLLKPESDRKSQVVVQGRVHGAMEAAQYQAYRAKLLPLVLESYRLLAADADIVLVEGAGSASEINLRQHDIANMGFARAAGCPVVLVGDIDRGGVIASLVGTHTVLAEADRAMIRGFLVNKFRGDPALFASGMQAVRRFTGWAPLGLVPHHAELGRLPQEDSLGLKQRAHTGGGVRIVALAYPHTANFDDIDPLANDPAVRFSWVHPGEAIPADAALVILPGSKATMADLAFVRAQGWDMELQAHLRRGGQVLGICGGYQMLGRSIADPCGVEGGGAAEGLGLLNVSTVFGVHKTVAPWRGTYEGIAVEGYELHAGQSAGPDCARPVFDGEGARSADGRIWGTYVHGLFSSDRFRQKVIMRLGGAASTYGYAAHMQQILDGWADVLEQSVDVEQLLAIAAPAAAAAA